MKHPRSLRRVRLPFQKHRLSQEIPIRDKQESTDDTVPIVNLEEQQETECFRGIARQYTDWELLTVQFLKVSTYFINYTWTEIFQVYDF